MEARFTDRIRTQSVRELAWAIEGPSLIDHSADPSLTPFIGDGKCAKMLDRARASLLELDADPSPLEQELASRLRNGRLGERFEVLIAYLLEKILGVEDLHSRISVRNESRTLGEMDFVFRDPEREMDVHWEVSTKFFMQTGETLSSCVGTDTTDRVNEKIDYLLNTQLKLPLKPEARLRLNGIGFDEVISEAFVKGYLFQPRMTYPHLAPPSPVSSQRSTGWWSRLGEVAEREKWHEEELEARWLILPRLIRIAPGRTEREDSLCFGHELPSLLNEKLIGLSEKSVMLARMERVSGAWIEVERAWVVPDSFDP